MVESLGQLLLLGWHCSSAQLEENAAIQLDIHDHTHMPKKIQLQITPGHTMEFCWGGGGQFLFLRMTIVTFMYCISIIRRHGY